MFSFVISFVYFLLKFFVRESRLVLQIVINLRQKYATS